MAAAIAVMDQPAARLAGVKGLLERIEHQVRCSERVTRQPTIRRAKTSMTNATYTNPAQVAT